jgi:hypothetical protein
VNWDAAPDQAPHPVALLEDLERERQQGLDLGRIRPQVEPGRVRDPADEGVDPEPGDECRGRGEGAADVDFARRQGDLLLGLAQRGGDQIGVVGVAAAARERDLAGVAAEVCAALGEDQPRAVGPAVERQQDGGVGLAADLDRPRLLGREQELGQVAQMITWTVPPSTDQAAPLT